MSTLRTRGCHWSARNRVLRRLARFRRLWRQQPSEVCLQVCHLCIQSFRLKVDVASWLRQMVHMDWNMPLLQKLPLAILTFHRHKGNWKFNSDLHWSDCSSLATLEGELRCWPQLQFLCRFNCFQGRPRESISVIFCGDYIHQNRICLAILQQSFLTSFNLLVLG